MLFKVVNTVCVPHIICLLPGRCM